MTPRRLVRPAPAPPSAEYLAIRERLGSPSSGDALTRRCPWCGSAPGERCQVSAVGKMRHPHHERQQEAAEAS